MPYTELIKSFERIRNYMRDFYVYGFKSRTEYDKKSARSYDNERRRMESWLGDYMSFRQTEGGKNVLDVYKRQRLHRCAQPRPRPNSNPQLKQLRCRRQGYLPPRTHTPFRQSIRPQTPCGNTP